MYSTHKKEAGQAKESIIFAKNSNQFMFFLNLN